MVREIARTAGMVTYRVSAHHSSSTLSEAKPTVEMTFGGGGGGGLADAQSHG